VIPTPWWITFDQTNRPDELSAHTAKYIPMVSKFNGFYDRSSSVRVYLNYCDELMRAYESSETLFLCNYQLLSLFFKDVLNPLFSERISKIGNTTSFPHDAGSGRRPSQEEREPAAAGALARYLHSGRSSGSPSVITLVRSERDPERRRELHSR